MEARGRSAALREMETSKESLELLGWPEGRQG